MRLETLPPPLPPLPPLPPPTEKTTGAADEQPARVSVDNPSSSLPPPPVAEAGVDEIDTTLNQEMLNAATAGDVARVQSLLLKRADVNAKGEGGHRPIHKALEGKHNEVLQVLLDHHADVNCRDERGGTVLHFAVAAGTMEQFRLLMQDADLNAKAQWGITPLMATAMAGKADKFSLLVEHGADVMGTTTTEPSDAPDFVRLSALHTAAARGWAKQVKQVLDRGGDARRKCLLPGVGEVSPLMMTVAAEFATSNELVMRMLIEAGADVNEAVGGNSLLHQTIKKGTDGMVRIVIEADADIHAEDADGLTALHAVAKASRLELAQLLLDRGADANKVARSERQDESITPLIAAVISGKLAMVRLMLEHSADPNCKVVQGITALHKAAERGSVALTQLLLDHGAEIDPVATMNDWGEVTPLAVAAHCEHGATVRLLLDKHANPNFTTSDGRPLLFKAINGDFNWCTENGISSLLIENGADPTACGPCGTSMLHKAVSKGRDTLVPVLLSRGADVDAMTDEGHNALSLACQYRRETMAKMLVHRADVHSTTMLGWTPLHAAASFGFVDECEELLMKGADINAENNRGETPLHCAAVRNHDEVVALLLRHGANPDAENANGHTPRRLASKHKHRETMALMQPESKGCCVVS